MKTKVLAAVLGATCMTAPFIASADQISDLRAQVQQLIARIQLLQTPQAPTSNTCPRFARYLRHGISGDDVLSLQRFLIVQNFLSADSATGYFGRLTESAVQRWQFEKRLVSGGSPATTGYGVVGPRTRAEMANCAAPQPYSCSFNGQSVENGASVTAYQSASVSHGQSCIAQTRTCSNGILSGTNQYTSCTVASQSVITVFKQPTINDVGPLTFINTNPPAGSMGVILWGGNNYSWQRSPSATHLTPYTGLLVPEPSQQYQVSVDPLWPGSTGVQAAGDIISINIHSDSIRKNMEGRNLGTVVLGYTLPVPLAPFTQGEELLTYIFDMKVPYAYVTSAGVAQMVAYFSFTDTKSNRGFWYGMQTFDNRGISYPEYVMWDAGSGGTNVPIVVSSFFPGAALASYDSSYARSQSAAFADFKTFKFVISADNLRAAIGRIKLQYPELNTLSDDPADYTLTSFNMNPEVFAPPGSFAHIGVSFKDILVTISSN